MLFCSRPLRHLWLGLVLGLAAAAQVGAAPGSYALTVYGEAPKYPPDFKHFDYVNPAAPKGGSLSRASMEIGQFNYIVPYLDQGTGVAQVDQWLYSPLAFRALDEPYTVYGLIAQRMERDPEGLWVRFYLNPKARFADDTPITADDVAFTYSTLMSKGSLSYRLLYGEVKEVLVENPQQILFTFKTNQNRTLALDLASMRILPQHWWQSRNFANGGGFEAPLGSGPYSVTQVQPGRSITFTRNPNWWAKDLPVSKGLYNFDRLTVNFYSDVDIARELLKAGAFDYNREFSATGFSIGYESPALSDGRLQRAVLAKHKPGPAQGFVFNLQNPFFQDRRVRQAISLLWDFEWTNKQMMRNFYVRQHSYFPKSAMAASALPDARELEILEPLRGQVPDEVFSQVYQAPKTDGSGYIRDKQLQALALLKQAGWTPKDNKLVNAQGVQLSFTFLDGQGGFDRMILPFKRTLAQIGIHMDIRKIDSAQYINRINSRDYDMIAAQFPLSGQPIVSPGREMYDMYGSRSATQPGASNSMVLRDPAVDRLLDALVKANSRDEMVHYARALDRVLQWGYYIIPNYYSVGTPTVYQNRFGRPATEPLYDEGLDSWWEVSTTAQPAAPSAQGQ